MVEQRRRSRRVPLLLETVLLVAAIVAAVSALGYWGERFANTPQEVTVTTTATTTQISTLTVTVTNTKTTTSTVTRLLPQTFPPPANSSAVIRSFYLFDGRVLATLSVDKPVYSQGETVRIKATLTNLTPDYLTLDLYYYDISILNSSKYIVWTYPEYLWQAALAPGPPELQLTLAPSETKTGGPWSTADWNMTGLHLIYKSGYRNVYDDNFVPEGQYTLRWAANIHNRSDDKYDQPDEQTITFTITKPK